MILSATVRPKLVDTLGVLKLAAGAPLLVALSWEILAGDHALLTPSYLTIQFLVCVVFLCDFFVRLWLSERRGRFFFRHLFFLLFLVAYLNLLAWSGGRMAHYWGVFLRVVSGFGGFFLVFVIVELSGRGGRGGGQKGRPGGGKPRAGQPSGGGGGGGQLPGNARHVRRGADGAVLPPRGGDGR